MNKEPFGRKLRCMDDVATFHTNLLNISIYSCLIVIPTKPCNMITLQKQDFCDHIIIDL